MKAYKIDLSMYEGKVRELISEAVQKKAFELGYAWGYGGREVQLVNKPYVFLDDAKTITWVGEKDRDYFLNYKNTGITAADFLALTTAKDAPAFKTFDKVLVRDEDDEAWRCNFFSHMDDETFICAHAYFAQCIPYEGNEHLVGTTESPK